MISILLNQSCFSKAGFNIQVKFIHFSLWQHFFLLSSHFYSFEILRALSAILFFTMSMISFPAKRSLSISKFFSCNKLSPLLWPISLKTMEKEKMTLVPDFEVVRFLNVRFLMLYCIMSEGRSFIESVSETNPNFQLIHHP